MWEFKQFGSSCIISHCPGIHRTLLRNKNGIYTLLIPSKNKEGKSNYISNVPGECPGCKEPIPEYIIIQMKLLQS